MHFSRKAKTQRGSRLMQLPTEIRLMILRLSLVHDGPLRARNWYGDKPHPKVPPRKRRYMRLVRERKEEVTPSYNLSPEILATCQALFSEGYPLLYSANTLGLQICAGDGNLDADVIALSARCGCGTLGCHGGMFVYAVPYVCTSLSNSNASTVLDLLQKFDKLHIDINNQSEEFDDEDDYDYDECPLVRQILLGLAKKLQNKAVQVKFINPNRARDAVKVEGQLTELMMIRCKEFKILNTELPASTISTVVAIVKSDRPTFNLYEMLENLRYYCGAFCCTCTDYIGCGHECEFNDDFSELSAAVYRMDVAEFLKLRAGLLERIDEAHKRAREFRKQVSKDSSVLAKVDLPIISLENKGRY